MQKLMEPRGAAQGTATKPQGHDNALNKQLSGLSAEQLEPRPASPDIARQTWLMRSTLENGRTPDRQCQELSPNAPADLALEIAKDAAPKASRNS